jgi:hypothetical protein
MELCAREKKQNKNNNGSRSDVDKAQLFVRKKYDSRPQTNHRLTIRMSSRIARIGYSSSKCGRCTDSRTRCLSRSRPLSPSAQRHTTVTKKRNKNKKGMKNCIAHFAANRASHSPATCTKRSTARQTSAIDECAVRVGNTHTHTHTLSLSLTLSLTLSACAWLASLGSYPVFLHACAIVQPAVMPIRSPCCKLLQGLS